MQEVCALEVAGAIKQARRGHVPHVYGPKAEREDQPVGAQAFGSEPSGGIQRCHVLCLLSNRRGKMKGRMRVPTAGNNGIRPEG